jgi:hypothetical protein
MPYFKPAGDRSYRDAVLELATVTPLGELLEFTRLASVLRLSTSADDRTIIRGAVSAARPRLIRDHGRALIAVRGKGYRIARPGELADVAQDYRQRADRQVNRALLVVKHADTSGMTAVEYQRFEATRIIITSLHMRMNMMDERLARLESAIFGPELPVAVGVITERHDEASAAHWLGVNDPPDPLTWAQRK